MATTVRDEAAAMRAARAANARAGGVKFEGLQILRFLAASAVVAFHAYGAGINYLGPYPALSLLHHGDYGVDLFFVLSGFIIFLTANGREVGWKLFLARRVLRVAPLYWLTTLAFCALLVAAPALFRSVHAPSAGYVLSSLFYVSFMAHPFPVIYVGWSLEYEMFFYLAVAFSGFAGARRWLVTTGVIAALIVLGRFVAPSSSPVALFLVNPIMIEFLFGILIGHVLFERRIPWPEFGFVAFALCSVSPEGRGLRVLVAGIPALAIVALVAWFDQRRRAPMGAAGRLLVRLGDASYSIYLLQIFTVSLFCKIAIKLWPDMPMPVLVVDVTLATALTALLAYKMVESPLHHWARRATARWIS